MLDMTMAVKLIDFGRARNLLQLDVDGKIRNIKNDILGVIRIFCALYSGVDFDDLGDAVKQLQTNNLSKVVILLRLYSDFVYNYRIQKKRICC